MVSIPALPKLAEAGARLHSQEFSLVMENTGFHTTIARFLHISCLIWRRLPGRWVHFPCYLSLYCGSVVNLGWIKPRCPKDSSIIVISSGYRLLNLSRLFHWTTLLPAPKNYPPKNHGLVGYCTLCTPFWDHSNGDVQWVGQQDPQHPLRRLTRATWQQRVDDFLMF